MKRKSLGSRRNKASSQRPCNFFFKMMSFIRFLFDRFIDYIFRCVYCDFGMDHKRLPQVKDTLLTESALSLASKIRNRKVTSEHVVKLFIERAKEVNPFINGLVQDRFEEALEEARNVDKLISESTDLAALELSKPFLGVPFTSKESTAAKGCNFSFGLLSRKGCKAREDADIVKKTKDSGAILIGVTNVPELNLWSETRNNVYGQTNNPFNFTRTVGGSSGGESSLITCCGTAFGLGTDIGGSSRMPAFYCGIFGHKPTSGLTSSRGMTFRKGTEKNSMVSAGTMTKYAEDITPLLKVLIGPENIPKLKLDSEVDISKVNVVYVEEPGDMRVSPVSDTLKCAVRRSVNHLATLTETEPRHISIAGFRHSYSLWRHAMTKEEGNFPFDLGNRERTISLWSELPFLLTGSTQFTLPSLMRLWDMKMPKTDKKWAERETSKLLKQLLEELDSNGVLIFPSCPDTAPYHYATFFRPYNFSYWAIFNVLNLPVTQVPLGVDKTGLPIGVQVVGAPYQDHLCIAVAQELERAFGGWVSPSSVCQY
ncbi:fatty-acid amide hydrolase 2 isoform X2 [Nilaparvata lugens]|uniref:fatty-acid amide hydrolase 2 isoform X2 n=1 Tax=Nilaparvata lugens TaxID=108931 RepID=UPI00193DE86A|nr:fatty-acid amide hydrolase 2 isoform X2 [Nilaparvata lugens]